MGIVLVDSAYAVIIREQNIIISPSDMNVLLSTIQSHPAVKKTMTTLPICLPGISDEGFIYLIIKYITPDIGIIYASLAQDNFIDCKNSIDKLDSVFISEGINKSITKCIETFYTEPYSKGNLSIILRN